MIVSCFVCILAFELVAIKSDIAMVVSIGSGLIFEMKSSCAEPCIKEGRCPDDSLGHPGALWHPPRAFPVEQTMSSPSRSRGLPLRVPLGSLLSFEMVVELAP